MSTLCFARVAGLLKDNCKNGKYKKQEALFVFLFQEVCLERREGEGFDNSLYSNYFGEKANMSPEIIECYKELENQKKVEKRIETELLDNMSNSDAVTKELYHIVMEADNLDESVKESLVREYLTEKQKNKAKFIACVLCYVLDLPNDGKKKSKKTLSKRDSFTCEKNCPIKTRLPKPCSWFLGRERDLRKLHLLLERKDKVFLRGIPGIGKSELAKSYVERYKDKYTSIVYIDCADGLLRGIIKLPCVGDQLSDDKDVLYRRHMRALRAMRMDALLLLDNFNGTTIKEQIWDDLLQLNCIILFTTRNWYADVTSLEVRELGRANLRKLMGKFSREAESKKAVYKGIINLLHRHTYAVELAARLLACGILSPEELYDKLKKEKIALDVEEEIRTIKDGKRRTETYYKHIRCLFALYDLNETEKIVLSSLSLTPTRGISAVLFAKWMRLKNMNTINNLKEKGLIWAQDDEIALHPMIRDVVIEELKPSVRNNTVLLDSLAETCLYVKEEKGEHKEIFYTIDNIIETIQKDDMPRYLKFLEAALGYMELFEYNDGVETVIEELMMILADGQVESLEDRTRLLVYCGCEKEDKIGKLTMLENALKRLEDNCLEKTFTASVVCDRLGMLHKEFGEVNKASRYIQQGVKFAGVIDEHGVPRELIHQVYDFLVVLVDAGEWHDAYAEARDYTEYMEKNHIAVSLEYGFLQELMTGICCLWGDEERARLHLEKAMNVFTIVLKDEPELLERKKIEICEAAMMSQLVR